MNGLFSFYKQGCEVLNHFEPYLDELSSQVWSAIFYEMTLEKVVLLHVSHAFAASFLRYLD